jgi:hypothetical protein
MEGSSNGRSDTSNNTKQHSDDELPPLLKTSIDLVAITDLTPDLHNPRIHTRAQIKAIAKSIKTFGFVLPILHKNKRIIAGHGRYEAAKLNGLTHVPVVSLDHLTEPQARAFMIADNRLAERSAWDKHELALQLQELSSLRLDFKVDVTGFELPEIDLRIQSLDSPKPSQGADAADKFTASTSPAVSQIGDLWLLGAHRVCCGSTCAAAVYETLLAGTKASLVFADLSGATRMGQGARGICIEQPGSAAAPERPVNGLAQLTDTLRLVCAHTVEGAIIYACIGWRHMEQMLAAGRSAGCDLLDLCVWVKANGGIDGLYRSNHELVFVFRNRADTQVDIVDRLDRRSCNRSNVWTHNLNSFARKTRGRAAPLIPNKPTALICDAILDSTNRNDIVLSPNLGYGTTIVSAERTGRCCYGIESDPLGVDTAIKRWEKLTQRQARHACGQTFSEIKRERGGTL